MSQRHWMLLIAVALHTSPCAAETRVQNKGTATLEVQFEPTLTLADTITAILIVDATPSHEIHVPRDLPASSNWLLVERSDPQRETIKPGLIRWRQTFRCAPQAPGKASFTFPEVKLRDAEMVVQTIVWEPIPLTIATPTIEPNRANLRGDGTNIEASADPVAGPSWYRLAILGPLVAYTIVLMAVVIVVMRLAQRRKQPASALQRALYEWRRLMAMHLVEQGKSERFITLLTMIMREYLERDFDWPARRQTTDEFLQSLSSNAGRSLDDAEKRFLADFLRLAEEVKFGGTKWTREECAAWGERVRLFLEARFPKRPV